MQNSINNQLPKIATTPLSPSRLEFLLRREEQAFAQQPQLAQLKARLLTRGGEALTYTLNGESHLHILLEEGQWFEDNARLVEGVPGKCHTNAAAFWLENPTCFKIITGYALSADGIWRSHSWVYDLTDPNQPGLVETTEARLLYYGAILDEVISLLMALWELKSEFERLLPKAEALLAQNPLNDSEDRRLQFTLLDHLARITMSRGRFDQSLKFCQAELQLAKRINQPPQIAIALYNAGACYGYQKNYSKALEYFQQSLNTFSALPIESKGKYQSLIDEITASIEAATQFQQSAQSAQPDE